MKRFTALLAALLFASGGFVAAQFYAEVDGHPQDTGLAFALEELDFYSHEVRVLGVYPASPFRKSMNDT